MSERPVKGDIPDETPIPEEIRKQVDKEPSEGASGDKDDVGSAPESGDKSPD